jgi:hypothetical protein
VFSFKQTVLKFSLFIRIIISDINVYWKSLSKDKNKLLKNYNKEVNNTDNVISNNTSDIIKKVISNIIINL